MSTPFPDPWPEEPCPACGKNVRRRGSPSWPVHASGPDTWCEGSRWTTEEIHGIQADREEHRRSGRYVRPHP